MNTSARRAGYRLFGAGFDYILHLRPAEWPIMAGHTLLGYLLAVGVPGALRGEQRGAAVAGLLLWVVLLWVAPLSRAGLLLIDSTLIHLSVGSSSSPLNPSATPARVRPLDRP